MRSLILFDIDGTVLSHKTNPSHIPEATREAIALLRRAGHAVAFDTARSRATASRLMRELDIPDAVLCGGAHIVMGKETVLLKHIDGPALSRAIARLLPTDCAVFAADERDLYTLNASDDSLSYLAAQIEEGRLKALRDMERACKLDIYGGFAPDDDMAGKADVKQDGSCTVVQPAGTSKEQGLAVLSERMGIPLGRTVAVGDGLNDIGMLRAAGMGVAVDGAPEAVRAAAGLVAGAIEEGGILDAMKRLGLI